MAIEFFENAALIVIFLFDILIKTGSTFTVW